MRSLTDVGGLRWSAPARPTIWNDVSQSDSKGGITVRAATIPREALRACTAQFADEALEQRVVAKRESLRRQRIVNTSCDTKATIDDTKSDKHCIKHAAPTSQHSTTSAVHWSVAGPRAAAQGGGAGGDAGARRMAVP